MNKQAENVADSVELDIAFRESVETGRSWFTACGVLLILTFSFGAPLAIVIALKEIAADLGAPRSVVALASSVVWLGSGLGAIGFGWVADRIGFNRTASIGGAAIGIGLVLSSMAVTGTELVAAHLVLVGIFGSGAINIPLMVYISRWFDRRRGSALALVTSGQYLAGAAWPALLTIGVERFGWRQTMLWLGLVTSAGIIPIAMNALAQAPEKIDTAVPGGFAQREGAIPGLSTPLVFVLLCVAGFLCCVPMAMPLSHLVALCSDLGIGASKGALMLSLLLGSAFISRQFWGWLADRVGGLWTILSGSACQAIALAAFLWTHDDAGLFAVSAVFGLGYSGIIPAYVVALRQLFPSSEASWRVPVWFFVNVCGMAFGAWLAGFIYDLYLSYSPAFSAGVAFNLANIVIIAFLLYRQIRR
jgi:MFS family permease